MTIFWAIILGIVQGLTEFFPVSSSAHLTLLPKIFNFPDPGLSFDIALHAGTFFAILWLFKDEWLKLFRAFFSKAATFEKKFVWFLIATSVPGAIFGALLEDKAKTVFRSPYLIILTLIVFGGVLYLADRMIEKRKEFEKLTLRDALVIGFAQAAAIIPGVSRSGATITTGRLLGLSREVAVKYSFMAALPVIFGAAVFGLRHATANELLSANWIVGFIFAMVSSFWAMKFLVKWVKTKTFDLFVWYRVIFAIIAFIIIAGRK